MLKSITFTLFVVAAAVAQAQDGRYQQNNDYQQQPQQQDNRYQQQNNSSYQSSNPNDSYEVVEKNMNDGQGRDEFFKSAHDSSGGKSPQINIYNSNNNANKQDQKARNDSQSDSAADAYSDSAADAAADADSAIKSENNIGVEAYSRTNDIRNERQNMEVGTEQKMLEKLEWSRMEDEKQRANRLFGNRLENNYKDGYNNNDDYKPEYKTEKVIVIEKEKEYEKPAPAPVYPKEEVTYAEPANWWGTETYVAPVLGTASYSSATNVKGDMAVGVLAGSRFDSNFAVEGSFLYSQYEMDDYNMAFIDYDGKITPGFKNIDQYNFTVGVKYNIPIGRLMPHVGALLGYTYREYDESKLNNGTASSTAVDAGVSLGADIKVSKNFSLGAEYRVMKNISYSRDEGDVGPSGITPAAYYHPKTLDQVREPLEEVGYQMFLVNGKFSF